MTEHTTKSPYKFANNDSIHSISTLLNAGGEEFGYNRSINREIKRDAKFPFGNPLRGTRLYILFRYFAPEMFTE
jgi:hypothetical protein